MDNRVLRRISKIAVFFLVRQRPGYFYLTSRAANRNRGFRTLWGELFLTRNPRLTSTDIVLGSRARDAAPLRAGLPVAGLPFGEWCRS